MNFFKSLFYPSGKYNKKYKQYVCWSFLSNLLVSTQHVISVHNMLSAIDNNTESVRTINYIGKDIIGQTGSLFYISKIGKKIDKEPVKFLRYINFTQQISYISTSVTFLFPDFFLILAGSSSLLNNVSFIGFGSINTKCINQISESDNLGEIYAKISIFNTLGSSIGLLSGVSITMFIPDRTTQLCLLPIIGSLRIYTFNKAVKGLI